MASAKGLRDGFAQVEDVAAEDDLVEFVLVQLDFVAVAIGGVCFCNEPQREALVDVRRQILAGHRAALDDGGLQPAIGVDPAALGGQFDIGDQPVDRNQAEAFGQSIALGLVGLEVQRSGREMASVDRSGKFCPAHRSIRPATRSSGAVASSLAASSRTRRASEPGSAPSVRVTLRRQGFGERAAAGIRHCAAIGAETPSESLHQPSDAFAHDQIANPALAQLAVHVLDEQLGEQRRFAGLSCRLEPHQDQREHQGNHVEPTAHACRPRRTRNTTLAGAIRAPCCATGGAARREDRVFPTGGRAGSSAGNCPFSGGSTPRGKARRCTAARQPLRPAPI